MIYVTIKIDTSKLTSRKTALAGHRRKPPWREAEEIAFLVQRFSLHDVS